MVDTNIKSHVIDHSSPPAVIAPVARKSKELGVGHYLKDVLPSFLVIIGTAVGGYFLGKGAASRFDSLPENTQNALDILARGNGKNALPLVLAERGAVVGTIYSGYRIWRKKESKSLSVKDIHQELYTALDSGELGAQVEQNERIQQGIKTILEDKHNARSAIQPRGLYPETQTSIVTSRG